MKKNRKGFTILELLVVVAIIAILAVIAIPNFIGRIDDAKASQELAEINAVTKAINTYYADFGNYPTLQGKDGSLLQAQPIEGAPHNVDFSSLVPDYLASLPHFSYWWIDYKGNVYHTDKSIGALSGSVFTPTADYTYTLYKTNGSTQVLSAPYTLLAGEYIIGTEENGKELPKISSVFKNAKMHPQDPEYVAAPTLPINTTYTFTNAGVTGRFGPSQAQLDSAYASTSLAGKVTSSTGIQLWTVPATGTYRLETYGAQGGAAVDGSLFGKGAIIKGDFQLVSGQVLSIIVGQSGLKGTSSSGGGGGGGGTFLWVGNSSTPLVIAGGGGGSTPWGGTGLDANITANGDATLHAAGAAGYGGLTDGNEHGGGCGGGGGGWLDSGLTNVYASGGLLKGGTGGTSSYPAYGGFGGGGGSYHGGGGGGGYSGGSGGAPATPILGGGGGGSYNSGANQANTTGNTGMGKVIITYIGP